MSSDGCGGGEEEVVNSFPTTNNGGAMNSDIRNAINFSMLFPPQHEDHEQRIGSGHHRLQEPRQLYSAASLQHPPKWPIECQVVPEKIKHFSIPPAGPEPFYVSTGSEPQPGPVGEEMGTVIYDYQPKLCVDYYCRSCFGGSEELTAFDSDETTLKFESRFEAGNLAKVIKVTNVYYELYLRADMYTDRHAQWYYFRIRNTKENIVYRFSIVNLSKPDSLYRYGMKPLLYSEKEAEINGVGWMRSGHNISYYKNDVTMGDNASSYTLTFNLKFQHSGDTVYIAQCYPYTYSNLQSYLHEIQCDKNKARLCQQRLLCKSLAGNNVYVLTITTPESEEDQVKKPAIVLTARVHPGETPSSYMMKGIIDFLTSESSHAQALRDRFIFKLIPMLNPDGVIVGNSRCCLLGQDLNRQYRTVLREAFPQIYQKKVLLRRLVDENGIFLYCDIHGHSRKNNVFMYGCENRRVVEKKLTEQVFPLMMHKNAADKFSFSNCKFRIQKSKEGTGRIFVWTLGVTNSYTLEISLCGSTLVSRERTHFNFVDYEDLGRHFCETLLDYSDTAVIKEKIRQKILQKLIQGGSTADEPVNIPISDYSSLSHSDSDNDESDTTEDDEEIELPVRTNKPTVSPRQAIVRSSRAKKFVKAKSERHPLQLKTAKVEAETTRGDRKQRRSLSTTVLQAFRDERRSMGDTKLNLLISPRNLRRPSIPECHEFSTATTASAIKYANLRFDDPPFRPRGIATTGKDSQEEAAAADTGTQTEDECDLADASMKNEFYLPTASKIRENTLMSSFKSMSLLPKPKRIKIKSRPSSCTGTTIKPLSLSKFGVAKPPPPVPPISIRKPERRRSLPGNETRKQNLKIHHSKSQDEMRNKVVPIPASLKPVALGSTSNAISDQRKTFLSIPAESKMLPPLSPGRRVSVGEGATLLSAMTRFHSDINDSMRVSKKFKPLCSIQTLFSGRSQKGT